MHAVQLTLLFEVGLTAALPMLDASRNNTNGTASAVYNIDFPDPSIIEVDGTWYAFATGSNGYNIQAARSSNFDCPNWKAVIQEPLPGSGPWADEGLTWAPDVVQLDDGSFVMYYAAPSRNNSVHCIGAAKSDSVTGPYIPQNNPLACPISDGGAIDPASFQDPNTAFQYVLYKVDGNSLDPHPQSATCGGPDRDGNYHPTPIMLQRVRKDDGVTTIGSAVQLLDRGPYDGPLIEAPSMFYKDGIYFLFFSSNCYSTDYYDISYATSNNIEGPYIKTSMALITTEDGYGVRAPGSVDVNKSGSLIAFHGTVGFNQDGSPIRYMYAAAISVSGSHINFQCLID